MWQPSLGTLGDIYVVVGFVLYCLYLDKLRKDMARIRIRDSFLESSGMDDRMDDRMDIHTLLRSFWIVTSSELTSYITTYICVRTYLPIILRIHM